jgi:CelD/BcsL family acetyltransferase involved in cellulose biosynthesis
MHLSLITTEAAWAELKTEWDALLKRSITQVPFLLWDYQSAWWQTKGGGEWPAESSQLAIIIALDENTIVGIAPLFASEKADQPRALRFIGQVEVCDYLDLIVTPEVLGCFTNELLAFIGQDPTLKGLTVQLDNVLEDSPSMAALKAAAVKQNWTYQDEILQPSPYIPTPPDWEQYLAGLDKKQRHEIRRKLRNASTQHDSSWYFMQHGEKCQQEMESFLEMMRNEPDKDTFLNPLMVDFMQAVAETACQNEFLQLSFLIMDGEKAGAYLSFINQKKLLVYNSAWNPKFSQFSPGWVLLSHLIQWAIENGFSEVDMMRGNEGYKYKFGGINRHVLSVTLKPA